MVHTYECLGRFFLLDTESGSVFEVDQLTSMLIKKRISPKGSPLGDFSRFSNAEISEAEQEIDSLIKEGVLFSKAFVPPKKSSGIIKAMCLNITHDCNLRCTYCFADGGSYKGARMHMSEDTAKAAVDFLIAHSGSRKNLEIDFFGGEPILNFEVIKSTVEYAKKRGEHFGKSFRFTATTNALLLNKEHIDFLNAEMYNVVLSIDGRMETHDRLRKTEGGKGSYQTVLKNALSLKNSRIGQYYVRGTFTAQNLDFYNDVIELNDLGFDQVSVEPVVLDPKDSLAIKEEHLQTIFAEYDKLAAEYIRRRSEGKQFCFFHFNIDLENSLCESKRLKGCGAGCEYVAVAPSGAIYPCHQFDGERDYIIGDVKEGIKNNSIISQFDKSNVLTKSACADCWAKYYCSGGCNAANIKYAGGINNVCELSCKIMKKRLECAIAVNAIER